MRLLVTEEEKKQILSKHKPSKSKSIEEIEKEIEEIEKKLGRSARETEEGNFSDLLSIDSELESDREDLEQS